MLAGIAVMPKMLYYYGKIPENRVKTVAIVGARRNTSYGHEVAYNAAYALAKRGVLVISGLALGIDSIAHRGALDGGGTTIGVLGTPIEQIYPRRHVALAREMIEKGGAVMSEYKLGDEMDWRASFLHRNRLISGLADAVIVVEAAEKSGSLNTAAHALEQGREVFAVPGDINRATSKGCNRLISQGAQVYTGVDDVFAAIGLLDVSSGRSRKRRVISGDNELETAILRELAAGARDGDAIIASLAISAAEFNRTVTLLEIKGRIRALGANNWALIG